MHDNLGQTQKTFFLTFSSWWDRFRKTQLPARLQILRNGPNKSRSIARGGLRRKAVCDSILAILKRPTIPFHYSFPCFFGGLKLGCLEKMLEMLSGDQLKDARLKKAAAPVRSSRTHDSAKSSLCRYLPSTAFASLFSFLASACSSILSSCVPPPFVITTLQLGMNQSIVRFGLFQNGIYHLAQNPTRATNGKICFHERVRNLS